MTLFIVTVAILAGLGYWNWKKGQQQLDLLRSTGFVVSDDLNGNPRLVLDRNQRQLAVVAADRHQVVSMGSVVSAQVAFDRGVQMDENFRIELTTTAGQPSLPAIQYENEAIAQTALKTLLEAIE